MERLQKFDSLLNSFENEVNSLANLNEVTKKIEALSEKNTKAVSSITAAGNDLKKVALKADAAFENLNNQSSKLDDLLKKHQLTQKQLIEQKIADLETGNKNNSSKVVELINILKNENQKIENELKTQLIKHKSEIQEVVNANNKHIDALVNEMNEVMVANINEMKTMKIISIFGFLGIIVVIILLSIR